MIVHPRRKTTRQVEAPLTSLIDMVFLLLIYFLLTTSFMAEEGIQVKPPRAKAGEAQAAEAVTIVVDRQGRAFIDAVEFAETCLLTELKDRLAPQPDLLVVVKADRASELEKAVRVLDLAREAGARRLSLATEKDN